MPLQCRPFKPINIPDRTWPDRQISASPRWLSSDLRDGNQSNVNPMNVEQKTRFFELVSGHDSSDRPLIDQQGCCMRRRGAYMPIVRFTDAFQPIPTFLPSQLVKCGFKEIEIAYPAASETDFSFVRMIVDKKMGVDEGIWIQVCHYPSLISPVIAQASSYGRRTQHIHRLISNLRHNIGSFASSRRSNQTNFRSRQRLSKSHLSHVQCNITMLPFRSLQ